jgi:RNA polymerase sigma-70 factor, ECF subfamily
MLAARLNRLRADFVVTGEGESVPTDQSELLRAIHDAHGPALMRFALRLTGDYTFAQDVVQEAMLRAWKKPAILEQSDESARAWLFTVVRNIVIDDRRSARHAREILTDNLPDPGTSDGSDALLDAWVLSDALASLSVEHRTAVVSAYYLGQSVAEIARRNDLPEGTVKSRLHYALRAMRIALQERGVTQ